ncbi:TonB-dependent receptor plug domain-containing protein [Halarcobacter sp.]|uniref:TonB-dependent receptor plug domain-containing protein n=1 Tax=Halarcobacter sp. TaxID=2321133 RepID=UPI002AAB9245|nr:TonB-dependent receptor plug domain-containing protein [Halarcobacter sp.]
MNKKTILSLFTIVGLGYSDTLPTISVSDKSTDPSTISSQNISQKDIELMSHGNGDIGSVLKLNPNIQVEDKFNDKDTISDIKPSKIRINGAKFYQNSLLLDGISNDSLLDPVNDNDYAITDVPGNENSMYIDLDLVESIDVYDSGISAKYGNFNGGVIDVKLKRPSFERKTKFKYRHTSESFVNFHTKISQDDDTFGEDMESLSDFEKTFFTFHHNQPINEKSAVFATYNYKKSILPKDYFSSYKDETQENHNLLLKYSYFFDDDSILDLTGIYSNFENKLFRDYVLNSDFTNIGSGLNIKANYEKSFDFWNMESAFALGRNENSREDSATDYKKWLRYGSKPWGIESIDNKSYSKEGGYGNIEKTNDKIELNSDFSSKKFSFLNTENELFTGFQLSYQKANYTRDQNSYSYYNPIYNSEIICNGYTSDCVDREQYFSKRIVYKAEDVDVDMASLGLYFEDNITYKNLQIKPGIRLDYNTYLKNYDFSPRLNISYDLFGNGKTVLFGGLNRYYDKSLLAFKLREARSPYQSEYRSRYKNELNSSLIPSGTFNNTVWNVDSDKGDNRYTFSTLDTPYTDEKVIGLRQEFFNNYLKIKYIQRDSKNQFKEETGEKQSYIREDGYMGYYEPISVTNNGVSEYDSMTISIENVEPIKIGEADFSYMFSTRINNKNETNFLTYDLDDNTVSRTKVQYKDELINRNLLPSYDDPQVYKLYLALDNIKYKVFNYKANISFSSIFKYTEKYKTTKLLEGDYLEAGADYQIYEDKEFREHYTIDAKVNMYFPLPKKQSLNASLEVINLLDRENEEQFFDDNYSIGRQVWLELSYTF